jgi:dynein heavy chain
MAKQFIDVSFNNLRSAEGAFDLLQNFKNLKSRASINDQMKVKYADVLKRYEIELNKAKELFQEYKNIPPVHRNQAAISGAINWSRLLFSKVKRPMLQFKAMPGKDPFRPR